MQIFQNKRLFAIIQCIATLACVSVSDAHDEKVHAQMSQSAFNCSSGLSNFLTGYYALGFSSFATSPTLITRATDEPGVLTNSPLKWLMFGSLMEDVQDTPIFGLHFLRSSDHFYTVTPSRIPGQAIGLTDTSETAKQAAAPLTNAFIWGTASGIAGPEYHLSTPGPIGAPPQTFGGNAGPNNNKWSDARLNEYGALTNSYKTNRDATMALTLYVLGHVLHLAQDMSQPEHVRNDEHPRHQAIEQYGLTNYLANALTSPVVLAQNFPARPHGWTYWQTNGFQKLLDFWDRGLYTGNASALNNDATNAPGKKLGLAEFSNGNFLGQDALYAEFFKTNDIHYFPYPSLYTSTTFPALNRRLTNALATSALKSGTLVKRFRISKTGDGIAVTNHSVLKYASSKIPEKLASIQGINSLTTIDDPQVLQEYHSILIPKAIEYSAGILDYFFRGTVDVSLSSDPFGRFLSLVITNTSSQDLTNGAFQLFYDDTNAVRTELTGTNFVSNFSGALAAGATINATFVPVASAMNYTLVYKGTIGYTNGAALDPVDAGIAIATKTFTTTHQAEFTNLAGCYGASTVAGSTTEYYTDTDGSSATNSGTVTLSSQTPYTWSLKYTFDPAGDTGIGYFYGPFSNSGGGTTNGDSWSFNGPGSGIGAYTQDFSLTTDATHNQVITWTITTFRGIPPLNSDSGVLIY
jgi:hypothetical protein